MAQTGSSVKALISRTAHFELSAASGPVSSTLAMFRVAVPSLVMVTACSGRAGQAAGFSVHAGVAAQAQQREKLERLCRYITRPAVSEKRLSLTYQGKVRYELKTPYRDGTTHVIFEPVDFIARLAALVPKPRVNLAG